MVSFYNPTPTRPKILIEADAFPSDRYAVASQVAFHGYDPASSLVTVSPRPGETALRTADICQVIAEQGPQIALILLGGVNYYTGQALDMQAITAAGHRQGCLVGFDLAHAAGNLGLQLHDWGVDFAAWCSYKYLNAGPGSVAGCFVHQRHAHRRDLPRLAGWWGHNKQTRFAMPPDFDPLPGAEGWQVSNPPILPLATLRAAMEIFDEAGMERLRAKSAQLTSYLEYLLQPLPLRILTPAERGAQLSLRVPGGQKIHQQLQALGLICDWREPDVLRVAPVPLYNRFQDVWELADHLGRYLHG